MTTSSLNTEEANKAVVARLYLEGFNQGKLEVIDQHIAPTANFITPGPAGPPGPEGFKVTVQRLREAFPDIRFTLNRVLAENDHVAVSWTWNGTHQGAFANLPPTGKSVKQDGMVMYQLADGKVVGARAQFDRLAVFQQLDVNPPASPSAPTPNQPRA